MTVYSGVINKNTLATVKAVKIDQPSIYRLNFVLLSAAVILFVSYVFLANFLAAQKYSFELRQKEFRAFNSTVAVPSGGVKELTMEELASYARRAGMVEAKDTDSILQNSGFAAY